MKIDYLSDLHLDFYFPIDKIEENGGPGEVLIIAGDIGHYNNQNLQILKIFQKNYYKYIICVLGNHDYYLINTIFSTPIR